MRGVFFFFSGIPLIGFLYLLLQSVLPSMCSLLRIHEEKIVAAI